MSTVRTPMKELRAAFGEHLQENVRMANYTTAHVGGTADALLIANNLSDLERSASILWELNVPFHLIGSGSNILVSDAGYRGLIIVNRAKTVKVDAHLPQPVVMAESGANLGTVARQVALRGLSGLEWAATIPGTVGGAVYGNAGAHGADMASNLVLADILHHEQGRVNWNCKQMDYQYRSSLLKRSGQKAIILSATMQLTQSTVEAVQNKMNANSEQRRSTQPPGASLGSMFKNPPGDYAGRLIEAAGLKGEKIGGAEISTGHANFFINHEEATAHDIYQLIRLAQSRVQEKFGVQLDLEVELLGEWEDITDSPSSQKGIRG
ncbi:MAG: UDP-N-acetylmuramate dehydrogenase [Anaerolineaceae bacterium]|nr:UDP-N-acetylmuramate dehydrogenase [Anaerolineaceae bacterium]NTV36316.1 UDP-N-acetylmuramate dehydrogenase [Anaerolineaceae bacterium]